MIRKTISRALLLVALFMISIAVKAASDSYVPKKREFRGAWIQCVNGQFIGMSTQKMQQTLTYQLDELQKDGVNAIFFQVRAECDALYKSDIEPWSRFLTGQQGKAPSPYWDPLQWMIEQCHKRGMELHAWINPYRAKTKTTSALDPKHVAMKHPGWVFPYDGLFILNPGLPESRDYICRVVGDIVERYDVDGIHMDDYFYPYPVKGLNIPDDKEYALYNNGIRDRGDWRRDNVNVFIKQVSEHIHALKPWVKFGVSPFGIYRNKRPGVEIGSNTNGTQNYDDLYADVLLWVNNGWVDYNVPQIYWQIGHKAADYKTLIEWWNRYASARPLFIGEDVERTAKFADVDNPKINQMSAKFALHSSLPNVDGTVLWYAKAAVDNVGNYGTMLRQKYWRYPALQPRMPFIDGGAPKKPKKLKPIWTEDGLILFWTKPKGKKWNDEVKKYVVYRFSPGEKVNIENPARIVAITSDEFIKLPFVDGSTRYTYVVTALDHLSNESKGAKKKIKL